MKRGLIMLDDITAVIFDLDNTLADRDYSFRRHAERLADMFMSRRTAAERAAFAKRLIELDMGGYAPKKYVYDTICSEFSPDGAADELFAQWNVSASMYTRSIPYAGEILEYLKEKYTLALLTNGWTRTQTLKLEAVGLGKYFECVMISEETGTAKPDREIYLMLCRRIGVSPENAVYIGDHFENDVKGPLSAGMKAVLFDRHGRDRQGYSPVIHSLEELKNYL